MSNKIRVNAKSTIVLSVEKINDAMNGAPFVLPRILRANAMAKFKSFHENKPLSTRQMTRWSTWKLSSECDRMSENDANVSFIKSRQLESG